ncbi:Density-regulated protein DRP1 [Artemisia annua]|uniref:Density-regulated protein DRP1 n=1 Tax=Artemisia annua TaxID=35608 RepID=A0A2U1M232_ARTAN|nr:Density-regulated protein DRP1 [Artemisia annua]
MWEIMHFCGNTLYVGMILFNTTFIMKVGETEVIIEKVTRNKRKSITTLKGLDLFGIKLSDASKKLGKKFATGASVVKGPTEKDQIDVQGDIAYDIVEFITHTWPDILKVRGLEAKGTRHNPSPSMHKNGGKVVQQEDRAPLYNGLAPLLVGAACSQDNPDGTGYSFANDKEICIKAAWQAHQGHLYHFLGNKTTSSLESVQAVILPPSHLKLELSLVADAFLIPGTIFMSLLSRVLFGVGKAFNGTKVIGAGIAYLIVAVNSDVTVKSHYEIVTLTSAASIGKALIGTKATLKEVWNISTVKVKIMRAKSKVRIGGFKIMSTETTQYN